MRVLGLLFLLCLLASPALAQKSLLDDAEATDNNLAKIELVSQYLQSTQTPDNKAYWIRGLAFNALGKYALAVEDFQAGYDGSGSVSKPSFQSVLGMAYYNLKDYTASLDYTQRAIDASPRYAYPYYLQAICYEAIENYSQARSKATEYIALTEGKGLGYYMRAFYLYKLSELEPALSDINRALQLEPNERSYKARKIAILSALGRTSEMHAVAQTMVEDYDENNPSAYSNIGIEFFNARDYNLAVVFHSKALDLHVDRARADQEYKEAHAREIYNIYVNRGLAYEYAEKYHEALSDYKAASNTLRRDYLAYYRMGSLQSSQQNYQAAINAFESCFTYKPDYPQGWVNLGFAYSQLGNRTQAIRTYNRALEVEGVASKALILNNRGFCYLELGNIPKAEEDLLAAIALDAGEAMAHVSLGELYQTQEKYEDAVAKFQDALAIEGRGLRTTYSAYYRLGEVYLAMDEPEKAVAYLQKAVGADPSYSDGFEQLGLALMAANQPCAANLAFDKALTRKEKFIEEFRSDAGRLLRLARTACEEQGGSAQGH